MASDSGANGPEDMNAIPATPTSDEKKAAMLDDMNKILSVNEIQSTSGTSSTVLTVPPKASLRGLPLELRKMIYRLVVAEEEEVDVTKVRQALACQPILQVCRQLRSEALPVFYETKTFGIWGGLDGLAQQQAPDGIRKLAFDFQGFALAELFNLIQWARFSSRNGLRVFYARYSSVFDFAARCSELREFSLPLGFFLMDDQNSEQPLVQSARNFVQAPSKLKVLRIELIVDADKLFTSRAPLTIQAAKDKWTAMLSYLQGEALPGRSVRGDIVELARMDKVHPQDYAKFGLR